MLYSWLDLQESMKDESFRNIYRNMNKIDKIFDKKLNFKQYDYLHDENLINNPYFSFTDNDVTDQNHFYGKIDDYDFRFYMLKDENRQGMVSCVDIGIENELTEKDVFYFTCKKYEVSSGKIKELDLMKIGETTRFNIYSNNDDLEVPSREILAQIDLLIPEGGKKLRFVVLSEHKIVYYVDQLSPFTFTNDDTMEQKKKDELICTEVQFFKKQLDKMRDILEDYKEQLEGR